MDGQTDRQTARERREGIVLYSHNLCSFFLITSILFRRIENRRIGDMKHTGLVDEDSL